MGRIPKRVAGFPLFELLEAVERIASVSSMLVQGLLRPGMAAFELVIVVVRREVAEVVAKFASDNQLFAE